MTPTERLDLVAYLDGELDEENARLIASKLVADENARREIESLERTWDLLDHLPKPRATESLGSKTVKSVTAMTLETIRDESVQRLRKRRGRLAITAVGTIVSFLIGLYAPSLFGADRTGRLARDLDIAEHFDEYQDAGNLDFLYLLQKSREFGDGD